MGERIEENVPQQLEDVRAGTFSYTRGTSLVSLPFYVRTLPRDDSNREVMDKRVDDANQQLTDAWTNLQAQGLGNITYKDVVPSPFF